MTYNKETPPEENFKDFYSFLLKHGTIFWGEAYFIDGEGNPIFISGDA